jgi:predicted GNAT family acetyltransferase
MILNVRKLIPGDETALEDFLSQRPETSMILRSNLRAVGLVYEDKRYHGDYFASFDNKGKMTAVLAHYWNGNILTQASDIPALETLARYFTKVSNRKVEGFLGETREIEILLRQFQLLETEFSMDENECLFNLDLAALKIPVKKEHSNRCIRKICAADLQFLKEWRHNYNKEALFSDDSEETRQSAMAEVLVMIESGNYFVMEINDVPVALSGFNASVEDCVQVGGVWTPPEHRNRGYARVLLAEILRLAHERGIAKALLFAKNPAAIKAYEAIGFDECGCYRLAFLKQPVFLSPDVP